MLNKYERLLMVIWGVNWVFPRNITGSCSGVNLSSKLPWAGPWSRSSDSRWWPDPPAPPGLLSLSPGVSSSCLRSLSCVGLSSSPPQQRRRRSDPRGTSHFLQQTERSQHCGEVWFPGVVVWLPLLERAYTLQMMPSMLISEFPHSRNWSKYKCRLPPLLVALTLPLSYLVKTSLVPLTGRVAASDISAAFKYGKFSSTSKS